ncbi:hypothetical protein EDB80DRAFT_777303 [Ilyonectria destructans]|nr:hypothetical protein EDB80DRAFT_777303 [Ilyonectria destructans]
MESLTPYHDISTSFYTAISPSLLNSWQTPLVTNCSMNDTGSLELPAGNHLVMDENVENHTQKHPFHPGHRGSSILSSVTSTPDSLQSPIGGSTGLPSSDIHQLYKNVYPDKDGFSCPRCSKRYKRVSSVKRHIDESHTGQSFLCLMMDADVPLAGDLIVSRRALYTCGLSMDIPT